MLFAVVMTLALLLGVSYAYGHGIGYETLPPQMLGGRSVAMEVSSNVDETTKTKDIKFSMFDTATGLTVRDVSYRVTTIKGSEILFEGTYRTSNGVLLLSLIPGGDGQVTVTEKKQSGIFGFLLGRNNPHIEARGKIFGENGLYRFTIDILSAENYSGERDGPVRFESGLSFPESASYRLNDAAGHEIRVMSYYDLIDDLAYDKSRKTVSFTMPFEWTLDNINQTLHVHEEVFIPKTLTDLQVSKYSLVVNGIALSERSLTIDDYPNEHRVIHILLYQNDLQELYGSHGDADNMRFELAAASDDLLLVDITDNVQYRIEMTTDLDTVRPGKEVLVHFKIYDVFLQGKAVSVSYDLAVRSSDETILASSGKSTDSSAWDEIRFRIPEGAQGTIRLNFENLGGNAFARSEIPLMILGKQAGDSVLVPGWIKNTAGWWCERSITDSDFLKGIEYLVAGGIIKVDATRDGGKNSAIPEWIRSNSCWWASGSITDADFVNGIAYLVKNGIIIV